MTLSTMILVRLVFRAIISQFVHKAVPESGLNGFSRKQLLFLLLLDSNPITRKIYFHQACFASIFHVFSSCLFQTDLVSILIWLAWQSIIQTSSMNLALDWPILPLRKSAQFSGLILYKWWLPLYLDTHLECFDNIEGSRSHRVPSIDQNCRRRR